MDNSCILNSGVVGNVVAVAVAAGDGVVAAGVGRLAHRQYSWELHASFSCSYKAAEMINKSVRLLYQHPQDVIKEIHLNAAQIVVRLDCCQMCTS